MGDQTTPRSSAPEDKGNDILLFGSLALSFDDAQFQQVRRTVVHDPEHAWAAGAIAGLLDACEEFLQTMGGRIQKTTGSMAHEQLSALREAWTTGCPLDTSFPLSNIILIPLVVASQLTQYTSFLRETSDFGSPGNPGDDLYAADSSSQSEVLGLCTGLLSAYAVSGASNRGEFERYGAVAIRLAMLVGLVVDTQDSERGQGRSRSLGVSWRTPTGREDITSVLADFPGTYLSVHYDENRATVTTCGSHITDLTRRLEGAGLFVTTIGLYGAFHSADAAVVDQVIAFCASHEAFQFPDASALRKPVRANDPSGDKLERDRLHVHALRSILLEPAHWLNTINVALQDKGDNVKIVSFGPERSIPPSVASRAGTSVRHLAADTTSQRGSTRKGSPGPGRCLPNRLWLDSDIAVVGMGCKVPGADDLEGFWDLLAAGESQHHEIDGKSSRFRFDDTPFRHSDDANMRRKWFANLLDDKDVARFDHRFFKKSARESATMDPQQRHLLQVAYQAVEQSGYLRTDEPDRDRRVGCFVGVCLGDYDTNVSCHPANAFTATGNLQGFIAGKVSHLFGWTGPGMTVDSACSSSLVAVHQACRSIISGDCNMALAGGSHIMTSAAWFQNLAAGSFLSPTGQCKPFDAKADGYCRGEGVGVVFLKRMSEAMAAGDQILGVIAATAVQQNENCTPIFVPNEPSLTDLFRAVTTKARIDPAQISVIEAHGTGTAVGDPIEYKSIRQALGGANRTSENPLVVGSVKGLVGHMECTSGIISLIKVLLMLNKGALPPQASFDSLNPALGATPADHMMITTRLMPWDATFRVALINNYGASGSNASMVVTQAPATTGNRDDHGVAELNSSKYPFRLRAHDNRSLGRQAKAIRKFLSRSGKSASLRNISFNMARQSNHVLGQGAIFTARSTGELKKHLELLENGDESLVTAPPLSGKPTVVLCFGGQVSTSIGLDPQVYDNVATLRRHLNNVDTVVTSLGMPSIFPGIFQREAVLDIVQLQVMLFATQYACARSWLDSGVVPAALVGHSFGELTAHCISGVLSLEHTVMLIANRATLVRDAWGADKGAMMAVEANQQDLKTLLAKANSRHDDRPASIACYNGPRSFTVAGSTVAIDALAALMDELPSQSMKAKRLSVTHAFHSALVEPLCARLEQSARGLTFGTPQILVERATEVDTTTTRLTPRFVSEHMRNPVYFHHAMERLAQRFASRSGPCFFIEAGSNSTITSMAARSLSGTSISRACYFQGINVLQCEDGCDRLTDSTVALWRAGLDVELWAHHSLERQSCADIGTLFLPPYQFDLGAQHWFELKTMPNILSAASSATDGRTSDEVDKTPEGLLVFAGSEGDGPETLAWFRVNTSTEEYKGLLAGHMTAETAPICPATVQMGFVIDAIATLHPEYRASGEPQIQEVVYHSPLCANSDRTTWIELVKDGKARTGWRFEVFSMPNPAVGAADPKARARTLHTTGKVEFSGVDDASLRRELVRFQRLFGHDRVVNLLKCADVDEVLANRSIYRMFADIVDYGEEFRGLQKLVVRGSESAGLILRKNSPHRHPDKVGFSSGFDAHLADTFCQLGGIWINCTVDRSPDNIYLANGIDKWIRAPLKAGYRPEAFHAFATHHHQPSERLSTTDVFVFDAADGALVEVILGILFVKIPKLSMQRLLVRSTDSAWLTKASSDAASTPQDHAPLPTVEDVENVPAPDLAQSMEATLPGKLKPVASKPQEAGKRIPGSDVVVRLKHVIADLSGLDVDRIQSDSELADLGIDSLAGMEMVHEIEKTFRVKLPEGDVLMVTDLPALVKCVRAALGLPADDDEANEDTDSNSQSTVSSNGIDTTHRTTPAPSSAADKEEHESHTAAHGLRLPFEMVMESFNEMKRLTDERVADFGQTKYSSEALPLQNELTVALTLEAFERLGAGIRDAAAGQQLPRIAYEKEHEHFVNHLYGMVESETQLIKVDGDHITRTAVAYTETRSQEIYEKLEARFPDQQPADKLTYHAGTNLDRVLSGETDGVKLIFGNPGGRELVSSFYAEWPLNQALYSQMQDFLARLVRKLKDRGEICESAPLRILEMGAGTGGTTKRIVPLLAQLQVPVEYTFTDLAPSFVAAARKTWGRRFPWMEFRPHDIERVPDADLLGTQHLVLASNAVHATHSLCASTRNAHKFLLPDGFLLMLEMTRTPYWVDLIFGLFEGWWMFDDGRRHALTHESRWKTDLQIAGYGHVDWTDGNRPESDIEKLILAAADPITSHYSRLGNEAAVGYQRKEGTSTDCEGREQVVARYVTELTRGFSDAMELDTHSVSLPAIVGTEKGQYKGVVLITGGTGGLGAHLVGEAASREDVTSVVCLNRRSRQDPRQRQDEALRKKGISPDPDVQAKIEVLEADLSQPRLGLSSDTYHRLLSDVTHIVHNAWLMHSKWPVKRFEPQLRIMANLLNLARDISTSSRDAHSRRPITFQFISSIAVIGHHPLWTGKAIVPEDRVRIESVLPTGYGDAKYICERMLDATVHRFPDRFRATAVRLGQVAGSRNNGHWNPMEHVPFLIKSSQTLRALPALPGHVGWTPAEDVAGALVDILTQPTDLSLHPIYHIENPVRQPWCEVMTVLANALGIATDDQGIIPFEQWVERVREWPRREDNRPEGANPGYLLVDFLGDNFIRMSCGGLLMATTKARQHSSTLARLGPVDKDLVRMYVSSWKETGFLAK